MAVSAAQPAAGMRALILAATLLGYTSIAFAIYLPALRGPLVSDDALYLSNNPYTLPLDASMFAAILDPRGDPALDTANYAPAFMLWLRFETWLLGDSLLGFHSVNVFLHALNALLFALLLRRSGVSTAFSQAAGLVFLCHPANVEAVAWITQSKTLLAFGLSFAALLLHPVRPVLSIPVFALALLVKPQALFALPMAAAFLWARGASAESARRQGLALACWAVLLAVYAVPQLAAFEQGGGAFEHPMQADLGIHLRTIAAIGLRYLAIAATGRGTSAYHEPGVVADPLSPGWLVALPLAAFFSWRIVAGLRARREEAAWWLGAAFAYGPISQVFPFFFTLADRYLYFILPGLIGGLLLASHPLVARLSAHLAGDLSKRVVGPAALVVAAAVSLLFAAQARSRAALWLGEPRLKLDAARRYPDGVVALEIQAYRAAAQRDVERTVRLLRLAIDRGYGSYLNIQANTYLAWVADAPAYQALLYDLAGREIARFLASPRDRYSQKELNSLSAAHFVRKEYDEAQRLLEQAIRQGGARTPKLIQNLSQLRAARVAERAR